MRNVTTPHRYAIRFVPPGNAHRVPLDAYAETMHHLHPALCTLVQSAADNYADTRAWPRFSARVFVSAYEIGSLASPMVIERTGEPTLAGAANLEREVFLRVATRVRAASRGTITDLPSTTAAALVSAVHRVNQVRTVLQLAESRHRDWRSLLSLSRVSAGLETYVANRRTERPATVQLVGRIDAVRFAPLSFDMRTAGKQLHLRARAEEREKLRQLWGREVLVTAEVHLTAEGEVKSAGLATSIEPLKSIQNPLADYLGSRGTGRGEWDSDEGRAYLESLRS